MDFFASRGLSGERVANASCCQASCIGDAVFVDRTDVFRSAAVERIARRLRTLDVVRLQLFSRPEGVLSSVDASFRRRARGTSCLGACLYLRPAHNLVCVWMRFIPDFPQNLEKSGMDPIHPPSSVQA